MLQHSSNRYWPLDLIVSQESLLNYRNRLFTEEAPQIAVDKFRSSLRQISERMKRRNKHLETPVEYLLPENISVHFDA